MIALRFVYPLRVAVADHMDATALHKFIDALVRGFDKRSLITQLLAGQLAQFVDNATAQLLLVHIDIGHAVRRGEAPAQLICAGPATAANQQHCYQCAQSLPSTTA